MKMTDIDVDESQTGGYGGEPIVLRHGWMDPLYMVAAFGLGFFFYEFFKHQSIENDTVLWGALVVSALCLVAALLRRKRTIEFNDSGISVNGEAVIPWNKIDEVVVSDGDGVWYKFRYSSYSGEFSYLTIPDYMTNVREAIKFAHKKLPGKFGSEFSKKPKNQPNVYINDESNYTTDYQDVIEDIDEDFSDNFSQKQKSPSDFYISGEIIMRSPPLSDRIVLSVIGGLMTFTCFFMYFTMREPYVLFASFVSVIFWIGATFWCKKIIFCNDGIIEKQSKPLIRWDDIYAVDIELAAYVFKYTAHDWGENSLRLPFRMQNIRKGIEAAKKKLPNLFAE